MPVCLHTYVHTYVCECMHCGSSLTAVSVVRVAAAEILPYLLQDISVKGVFSDSCSVCNAVSHPHVLPIHHVTPVPNSFTTVRPTVSLFFIGLPAVQQLWGSMADKLLDAMTLEVDSDVWAVMADSLCRVSG